MTEDWVECSEHEAAERSKVTITVLGRPSRVETFSLESRVQYLQLRRLCWPKRNWDHAKRLPVNFELAVLNDRDLGPEGLTVDNVMRVCAGYIGHAIEATKADRKKFGKRIYEAGVKRRGGELGGRAGSGRSA